MLKSKMFRGARKRIDEKEFENLARDQAVDCYGEFDDPYLIEKHVDMVMCRGQYEDDLYASKINEWRATCTK